MLRCQLTGIEERFVEVVVLAGVVCVVLGNEVPGASERCSKRRNLCAVESLPGKAGCA